MFRYERNSHDGTLKRLQEDKILRERMVQENKSELSRPFAQFSCSEANAEVNHSPKNRRNSDATNTQTKQSEDQALKEMKMRQLIRENSPEIRELESKLMLAYTNKLRSVQIAEKSVSLSRQRAQEAEDARRLAEDIAEAERKEHLREVEIYKEKIKYRDILHRQIEEQTVQLMAEAYLNFLNEKLMVDEIVRKIVEEDRRKVEMQLRKSREFQQQLDVFLKTQDEQRRKDKEVREEENRKILVYLSYKDMEREEQQQLRRIKEAKDARIQAGLFGTLDESRRQIDEEKNLQIELSCELKDKEEKLKEREYVEKRLRDRLKRQEEMEEQLEIKSQMMQLEREDEERTRRRMLAELAENERLEQLSNQKRRIKQQEHRRSVEAEIRRRQDEREVLKKQEVESFRKLQEVQADRQKMIEQEREKILKEHAVKLFGFLPKGVIQSMSELESLGKIFQQFYTSTDNKNSTDYGQ